MFMSIRIHVASAISMFAIACLLTFQAFWLYRTVKYKEAEFTTNVNEILVTAVETGFEEYLVGNKTLRQNYPRVSFDIDQELVTFVNRGDTTALNFNKGGGYLGLIRKIYYDVINRQSAENMLALDSICQTYFKRNGITDNFILELIDIESGQIIATTENGSSRVDKRIISNVIDLGLKSHHGLIAYFDMPYKMFFFQMAGAIASSFLMLIFIVVCFIYQWKTISFQFDVAKIREEFMTSMVHELKLPLAIIQKGFLDLKLENVEGLKKEQLEQLNAVSFRVQRLANFVHKLLNVWKQGFKITWKKLNLRVTIDELVQQFDSVFDEKKVSIKVDYQLGVDVVEADTLHFPNAISNLIENAIKYSGDTPEIEVLCRREGKMLLVAVKDHGIGIPEKLREKIFDRYFRISKGRSADVHGFGIGLSYVKQVIEGHNGVIRVEDTEGGGTTFIVMIPLIVDEND